MRRLARAAIVVVLCAIGTRSARAAQPQCTLDPEACIEAFGHMAERPWLGVMLDTDSTGRRVVESVIPGTPAEKAGLRPGDVLVRIGGMAPPEWFASKAGWKDGDRRPLAVERGGRERQLELVCHPIPPEKLARIVGEHMLEAHYAYMDQAPREEH